MQYFQSTWRFVLFGLACFSLAACGEQSANEPVSEVETSAPQLVTFPITNLSADQYPDNPDWGYTASNYDTLYFANGSLRAQDAKGDFTFFGENGDSIVLKGIDIEEFIPCVPKHLAKNEYMAQVALQNQEWNRNQVRFNGSQFESSDPTIVRVDLARNCLNSYLWEVILYAEEGEGQKPQAHGWFDFPHEYYQELVENRTGNAFGDVKSLLVDWNDLGSQPIDQELLREIVAELPVSFSDKSDEMYPVKAARLKKFKEIIYPTSVNSMRDLQSDSTLYATFTPPGFYNRADPRKTELGRIRNCENINATQTVSKASGDTCLELHFTFMDGNGERTTQLFFGGLDIRDFPTLNPEDANSGWKNSMGFGNHSFYETYEEHLACCAKDNPYYGYLADENGNWLDSHTIGIDGPIIHWDDQRENVLHVWLLSFERHSLVGHYEIVGTW